MHLRAIRRDDTVPLYQLLVAASEGLASAEPITIESVARQFDLPGIDVTRCMWVLEGEQGALDAVVSAIPLPGDGNETIHIGCHVHPRARGGDLEEHLLRFAEEQVPYVRQHPDRPVILHAGIRASHTDRARLLEKLGYTAVRWFLELERSLSEPIPTPIIPDGFHLSPYAAEPDLDEVYRVADEAFRDHWHQPRINSDQFQYLLHALSEEARLVLLARTNDGCGAGVVIAHVVQAAPQDNRQPEAEIALLGVRRPYRRQGLGTCLLLTALQWARDRGIPTATIGVDSQSITGANRLYRKLGFSERSRSVVYHKALSASAET